MPLCYLALTIAVAVQTSSQDSSASVTGWIRDPQGQPVTQAFIAIAGSTRHVYSDARGAYAVSSLPAGTVRLVVRGIGYQGVDTTFALRHNQHAVWNVTLHEPAGEAERRRGESLYVAAGGLDSIAAGLIHADTTRAFTYVTFGIGLLRAAIDANGADSNRVLSPLSAGQALALALAAARDSTAIAITQGLALGSLGSEGIAARTKWFNDGLRVRRDVMLKVANALWVDTSATLQPEFATWARAHYSAAIRSQPLRVPEVVPVINHWADSTTNHAIQEIRKSKFADSVVVVLTNAVYFKGRWLGPFDSTLTVERAFTTASHRQITARTMERTTNLAYRREQGYQVVRVPYTAGLTALYIVLPDSGIAAVSLLDRFVKGGWPLPMPIRESHSVQIRLPKLHMTQATDLRPPLTALGMGIAFDSVRADFSGLVAQDPRRPPPCPPLSSGMPRGVCTIYRINEADQHVFLDVDEKGTEAAAVTTLGFEIWGVTATPAPIPFYVDRPFLFALRDERTGTMLFVGYIATPQH